MTAIVAHADVERFRSLVAQRLGLNFEDNKLDFLEEVARKRIQAAGCRGFADYQQRFASSWEEARMVAELLTVCETYFFRYAEHFQAFAQVVVPNRIRARRQGRQLRILSAGCSSGEEAYSLAILIRDQMPELDAWDITIHGIDINPLMLKKALRAHYPAWSFRDTPADLRMKYFREKGRELELDDRIKTMVKFEERNLAEADPAFWRPEAFDVIFCRNVTMYFTLETTRLLIARIARSLTPEGFLFLGHAETLRGLSQDFHLRHTHETFYYQLRDEHEAGCALSPGVSGGAGFSARHVPAPVATTDSWFDIIQRASQRIATLTNGKDPSTKTHVPGPTLPPAAAWDRKPAMELLQQEKFREAIELMRGLPPEPQADPDAQLLLAVLLTNRGEFAEAERICLRLLDTDELNAGAHYLMALCREHVADGNGAMEHDQAAIYLDPAFAMPHLHMGLLAKRSKDMETAKRELGQSQALLRREDAARILLFGGGFTREALAEFCRVELRACGGAS